MKQKSLLCKSQKNNERAKEERQVPLVQTPNTACKLLPVYRPWPSAHAQFDASLTVHSLHSGGVSSAIWARLTSWNVRCNAPRLAIKDTNKGGGENQRQMNMKNQQEIEALVRKAWKNNVQGKFVYRGMDSAQLKFPLDPMNNPFEPNRRVIVSFFEILDRILDSGIQFTVEEEHFGKKCHHDPRNLARWSRRDINRAGIDFTSDYQNAAEYSDCWQGSQLKQNIKSISALLRRKRNDRALAFVITSSDWELINEVSDWVNSPSPTNPIIIHLRREVDLFSESDPFLPLGSENNFVERIMNRIMQAAEIERTSIMSILQDNTISFYCSICRPLTESDIFRIERKA